MFDLVVAGGFHDGGLVAADLDIASENNNWPGVWGNKNPLFVVTDDDLSYGIFRGQGNIAGCGGSGSDPRASQGGGPGTVLGVSEYRQHERMHANTAQSHRSSN